MTKAPHPVDARVGERIRLGRKAIGMSQEGLADCLKLTFQQVQKYERGANRVSASKLFEIAGALGVPMTYFFEGLAADAGKVVDISPQLAMTRDVMARSDFTSLAATLSTLPPVGARLVIKSATEMAKAFYEGYHAEDARQAG